MMSLFSWLVMGHLVGDWLLQNDWMARGKGRSWRGIPLLVHCALYMLAVCAAMAAAAPHGLGLGDLVGLAALAFSTHWLIDGFDLAVWWGRGMRQTNLPVVRMMTDQTLHLMVLAWAATWLVLG